MLAPRVPLGVSKVVAAVQEGWDGFSSSWVVFFFCAGCALCYLQHGVGTQRALPRRWGRCEKPLAGRTCHNLRAGCSFLEPVGSLMALHSARVSCAPRGTFLQLPS